MQNLQEQLENIQAQIDTLTQTLNEAQNKKLATEVRLQSAQEEFDAVKQQLTDATGMSDLGQIADYIVTKEQEFDEIARDVQQIMNNINPEQTTFTEENVNALRALIDKYHIPINL